MEFHATFPAQVNSRPWLVARDGAGRAEKAKKQVARKKDCKTVVRGRVRKNEEVFVTCFIGTYLQELRKWRVKDSRKPLLIRGARQVGKTTVVRQFATEYKAFIYLNMEVPDDRPPFENFSNFETLLQTLFLKKNLFIKDRAETLIFIDEIQEVPAALQQLRFFYEEAPDISVIAAGSMLESLFSPDISFPVGRVEYLVIHPVSFPEFLGAMGKEAAQQQLQTIPIPDFAHSTMLKLFRTYCLIGGMPEIVSQYARHRDLSVLASIYESLLVSYLDDVEKYASNTSQVEYIRHAIRSSFAEAGKRIKFHRFGHSAEKIV